MSALAGPTRAGQGRAGEIRKLTAFVRRDFLFAWSYRMAFVTDIINLIVQALLFSIVGLMVDENALPKYGGTQVTYMQFAAVGIAIGVFVQLALSQASAGIREEQLMGTLESVLVTPTAPTTIQLGAAAYEFVYMPLRTLVFLVFVSFAFDLNFSPSGILPALVIFIVFMPFVWGLGIAAAGVTLTYRRGSGVFGLGTGLLILASGLYFPLDLLPDWIAKLAQINPLALGVNGMRETLLGSSGWSEVWSTVAIIAPLSIASLVFGLLVFRRALRRELRRGTLGLY